MAADDLTMAYHEAGHATTWIAVDVPVSSLSITPLPGSGPARCRPLQPMGLIQECPFVVGLLGSTHAVRLHSATADPLDLLDRWIAGVIAEIRLKDAQQSARWLERCDALAAALVSLNATWIHRVADALLRRRSLSGEEVLGLRQLRARDESNALR
jgi:hypothetical protein